MGMPPAAMPRPMAPMRPVPGPTKRPPQAALIRQAILAKLQGAMK